MTCAVATYIVTVPIAYIVTVRWACNDLRRISPLNDEDRTFIAIWSLLPAISWPLWGALFLARRLLQGSLAALVRRIEG